VAETLWDTAYHLRAELSRVLTALALCLKQQRARGRRPAGDTVRGLVIEDGEAEGLLIEVMAGLEGGDVGDGFQHLAARRAEIATRATEAAVAGTLLPLDRARIAFELAPVEYDALLLALAVELDSRIGRIVAYLNDHVGRTRPTLGLAQLMAVADGSDRMHTVALADRPFLRDGLLQIEGDGPLPGLGLRLPLQMAKRLAGAAGGGPPSGWLSVYSPDPDLLSWLTLDDRVRGRLTTWSDTIRDGRGGALLLVAGAPSSGRATSARAACFRAALPVVQVEVTPETMAERMRDARRETRWHEAGLVVRWPATSQQSIDWRSFWTMVPAATRTIVVVTPEQASDASATAATEPAVVTIEEPDTFLRARLWTALLPKDAEVTPSELAELAGRFPFGPGKISRCIGRATADLMLLPVWERRLGHAALLAAARSVDSAALGPLAQKMPLPYERTHLIVPPHVGAELDLAIAWVRHRHRVLHEWGFGRRVTMGHGLTALFSGPSGTGKTMAAQVLARELNLDLYRVDLSQIMSKYIGDTEKNLALVFGSRVGVLFFDEAEAVLGKRHETKDPRDRYANVEVAYLLQRMEEYDGVTVLATNRMQDVDEAFLRRLHVVVDFPMPSEADRLRIWEGMLPADADRERDLDLAALAREFDISGGQIKNAALAAAYLAAAKSERIGMTHLRRAATRELVKSGKVMDAT
jgi:hypothetical protein